LQRRPEIEQHWKNSTQYFVPSAECIFLSAFETARLVKLAIWQHIAGST